MSFITLVRLFPFLSRHFEYASKDSACGEADNLATL